MAVKQRGGREERLRAAYQAPIRDGVETSPMSGVAVEPLYTSAALDAAGYGPVGRDGRADLARLVGGLPRGEVPPSMTISWPAALLLAMCLAVAAKQGVGFGQVGGTLQNDILKEYIAQKQYIFPPEP